MRGKIFGLLAATALALPMAANAGGTGKTISGTSGGLSFTAQSTIVGQTSTATSVGGGDPIYLANTPAYSGTVALIMRYSPTSAFICSGTLAKDGRSIITAAHCVSDGFGTAGPLTTTAYFGGGQVAGDFYNAAGTTAISVSDIFVNPAYTGEVIDQNDIAVLRLSTWAPSTAQRHDILTAGDLTGADFNVAGFGGRSDIGGSFGVNLGTGRLRQGDNKYDYRWGDAAFGGFFTDRDAAGENFFGLAEVDYSYVSDFDNGLAANDMSCRIATAVIGAATGFGCDVGRGATEVGVAGGDSGGPQFIGGKLASVTSYGLTFGTGFGDCRAGLNSSCGEYSGYVPTFIHADFIRSVLAVPEPATWLQMIFGFGLIGSILRRRQSAKVSVA
jgi:Trypsin/PEP-CTERM motif